MTKRLLEKTCSSKRSSCGRSFDKGLDKQVNLNRNRKLERSFARKKTTRALAKTTPYLVEVLSLINPDKQI